MVSQNELTKFHFAIGLFTIAILTSCSNTDIEGSWNLNEPDLHAVIDFSLCAAMPASDLTTPHVTRDGEDLWRIRYPLYEEGCGAYQLDTIMNFGAVPPEERFYIHEISVCNRCDSAQTWNYLYRIRGTGSDYEDFEIEVSQEPRIAEVSGLLPAGMPVVEHRTTSEEVSFRICAQLSSLTNDGGLVGERQPKYVSYDDIYSMPIESGEKNVQAAFDLKPRNFQSFASDLLARQLDEDGANTTAIYWPILTPFDKPITGATAASGAEFCTSFLPDYFVYPYPGEYDPFDKYTRQDIPAAELPPELVSKLQAFVEFDFSYY